MNALGKEGREGTNPPSHEVVDGSASEATLAFNEGSNSVKFVHIELIFSVVQSGQMAHL